MSLPSEANKSSKLRVIFPSIPVGIGTFTTSDPPAGVIGISEGTVVSGGIAASGAGASGVISSCSNKKEFEASLAIICLIYGLILSRIALRASCSAISRIFAASANASLYKSLIVTILYNHDVGVDVPLSKLPILCSEITVDVLFGDARPSPENAPPAPRARCVASTPDAGISAGF